MIVIVVVIVRGSKTQANTRGTARFRSVEVSRTRELHGSVSTQPEPYVRK